VKSINEIWFVWPLHFLLEANIWSVVSILYPFIESECAWINDRSKLLTTWNELTCKLLHRSVDLSCTLVGGLLSLVADLHHRVIDGQVFLELRKILDVSSSIGSID
jgi:hypothetical protein